MKIQEKRENTSVQLLSILTETDFNHNYRDILYDLQNKKPISQHIHPEKLDPFRVAISFLDELNLPLPQILVLKQGFPSVVFLQKYLIAKKHFIFPLPKSFLKEVNAFRDSDKSDALISIQYSKRRAHDAKITEPLLLPYHFYIRGIKISTEEGSTQVLLTDLLQEDYSKEEILSFYQTPEDSPTYNF